MPDYQKISGILLIAIVGLVAITLELARAIDIMANLTDVFFWIAAPVLGIAFGLLTRSFTKPKFIQEVGIRPTPTLQQAFIVSLAQEPDNIRMREIRVRAPSGEIYVRSASFYTVAFALPSDSENAPEFKFFFRGPSTPDQSEFLKIGSSGVPYMLVAWQSPNAFRQDEPLHYAGAVRMHTIEANPLTLTAALGRRLAFSPFVFFYTIEGSSKIFVPTFNAWDAEMPTKFQVELWAEARNRPRTMLVRFEIDARTWDNVCVTELRT